MLYNNIVVFAIKTKIIYVKIKSYQQKKIFYCNEVIEKKLSFSNDVGMNGFASVHYVHVREVEQVSLPP